MTVNLENEVGPKYQRLKSHIIARIKAGDWPQAYRLPSENELVNSLQVSRMTVNRALRELASEGYLTRVPGVGTFVAEIHSRSHFLEINNIADEVRERKHDYSARVIMNKRDRLNSENAERIQLPPRKQGVSFSYRARGKSSAYPGGRSLREPPGRSRVRRR